MVSNDLREAKKFYEKDRQGALSDKVIIQTLQDSKGIVYGARSVNIALPKYLERYTEDWDIYVADNPKAIASKIEKALDKRYGGNYFYVEPAKHEGTFKVKSKVTKRTVADITIEDEPIEKRKFGKVNYATLDFQVKKIKKSLSNKGNEFRHDKDKETLKRIQIYQAFHFKPTMGKKRVKRSKTGRSTSYRQSTLSRMR